MPLEWYIKPMEIKIQADGRVNLVDWNKKLPRWIIDVGLGANKI